MRPIFSAAVGFAAAMAISEFIGAYALIPVGACALFAIVLFFAAKGRPGMRDIRIGILAAACAAVIGAGWHYGYTQLFYSPAAQLIGSRGEYAVVVRDYPKRYESGSSVEVELEEVGAHARVRLWMPYDTETVLRPGDRMVFVGGLNAPDATPDFDFLSFYRARRMFLDGDVGELTAVEAAERTPLRFIPAVIRHALSEKFGELYSGDALALVRALCLGDRSAMSKGLRLAVRAGGLSHLLAISGLHITLLCGALVAGFRDRRRSKLGASFFAMLGVLMFILVCGAPASAVRAFVMHGFLLLAVAMRREDDPLNALGFSLIFLLAINPYAIGDVGLQLSFLSTFGLLVHFGKVRGWLSVHLTKELKRGLARTMRVSVVWLTDAVVIALIANLYTAPLMAYTFGSLAPYGVVANIPALVMVPPLLVLGLISGLAGLLWTPLGQFIAASVRPLCYGLRGIAYFFSRMPFALVDMKSPYNLLALMLTYTLIIIWRTTPGRPRGKLCGLLAALSFAVSFALGELERRLDASEVTLLDVGQGQSILLTSGGRTALVDCGGDCYQGAGCTAAEALMLMGRRTVDELILTHYHADHTNGLGDLTDFVIVRRLWAPPPEDEGVTERFNSVEIVENGSRDLTVGNAAIDMYHLAGIDGDNEDGLRVMISAGDFGMLITGDLGADSERMLLGRGLIQPAEVLVAGHHGSRTSTCGELLEVVHPQTAMISVGYDNNYGHPARSTVRRLDEYGVDVYRTDLDGSVTIRVGKEEQIWQ